MLKEGFVEEILYKYNLFSQKYKILFVKTIIIIVLQLVVKIDSIDYISHVPF